MTDRMNSTPRRERRVDRGFALLDAMIASMVLSIAVIAFLGTLSARSLYASTSLRETRVELLLTAEVERFLAAPAVPEDDAEAEFVPVSPKPLPESLSGVRWTRRIVREKGMAVCTVSAVWTESSRTRAVERKGVRHVSS